MMREVSPEEAAVVIAPIVVQAPQKYLDFMSLLMLGNSAVALLPTLSNLHTAATSFVLKSNGATRCENALRMFLM